MNPAVLQCGPALDTLGREHVESAPHGHAPVAKMPPCCSHAAPLPLPCRGFGQQARARPFRGWAVT